MCARASVRMRACEFILHVPSKFKVFRNLKRKIRNSFQFGGRAPASPFHLLYYLNLVCGRGGTTSKQWAADGSGPGCWSRVGGAPSGFTFCVRAAEQVKELGYAHNLRVVLRKWPKIWSCDGGICSLFSVPRGDRRFGQSLGWNLLTSCASTPPQPSPSGQRILLDGKTRRTEGKVDRRHFDVVHGLMCNSSVSV